MRMVIITNTSIHNINQSLLSLSLPHYLFLLAILRESTDIIMVCTILILTTYHIFKTI